MIHARALSLLVAARDRYPKSLEAVRLAGLADVVLRKGEATPEAIVAAIRAVCPVR